MQQLLPRIHLELASIDGAQHIYLNGEDVSETIRQEQVGMAASAVAAHPCVREFLLGLQRGMAEKQNIILTLVISGALAALGGALLYLTDYEQWQCTASSVPGMGFSGIAAAFLGGLHPIGTILASFFIQHITAGGAYVDKTMYCAQVSDLIAAVIIYLCGFVLFMKYAMNSAIARREEKAIQKAKAAEQAASQTDTSAEKGGDQ